MLEVTDLHVNYGPVRAVHGVSFTAEAGSITLVLGANGAGKTTSLRAVAGFHKPASGSVTFDGKTMTGMAAHKVVRRGMVLVPEGRKIFFPLTIEENLRIGGYSAPAAAWTPAWRRSTRSSRSSGSAGTPRRACSAVGSSRCWPSDAR
nr:ATP-binding cassette domain-containing protein [Nocardioides houyundeii]